MEQTLTLRYVPEVEDVTELLTDSPKVRRQRNRAIRNAITMLVLLCCAAWAGTVEPMSDTFPAALFFAVCCCQYTVRAVTSSTRRGLRRKARAVWKRSPALQAAHEEEIGPDAVTLRTAAASHTYAWSQFGGFRESDRQFVLLDRSGEPSIALPKRGLSDAALIPVCRTLLTGYLADPEPAGPVPTS